MFDVEVTSYVLGVGSMGLAWTSCRAWPAVWRARARRRHKREMALQRERVHRLMATQTFAHTYYEAQTSLNKMFPGATINVTDFDVRRGWSQLACGRGICAKGWGHAGTCDF